MKVDMTADWYRQWLDSEIRQAEEFADQNRDAAAFVVRARKEVDKLDRLAGQGEVECGITVWCRPRPA